MPLSSFSSLLILFMVFALPFSGQAADDLSGILEGSAQPDSLRLQRPLKGFAPSTFENDYSPTEEFNHWRQEYTAPTLCPMVLCKGSCAYRDSRCTVTTSGEVSQCPSPWMSESMYQSGLGGCESMR